MKKTLVISLMILSIVSIFGVIRFVLIRESTETEIIPTDSPQFQLPDGVRARIGKGRINKMALSPDNTVLAVASAIGIWLYDVQSGEEIALLLPHKSNISAIAFSPNSNILASGSTDKIVRLWDIGTGELIHTFIGHAGGIFDIVFSSDGTMLASASIHEINLWDINTRTHKQSFDRFTSSSRSRISFNSGKLLVAEMDYADANNKNIELTYLLSNITSKQEKKILEGAEHHVRRVSFSPDGEILAGLGRRNTFYLWDVDTGNQRKVLIRDTDHVSRVFLSTDGKSVVTVDKNSAIHILDIATGEKKRTVNGNFNSPRMVEIIHNGESIVSKDINGTISLWNSDNAIHQKTITGHPIWPLDVLFSPDGTIVATDEGWGSKNIHLWDMTTGKYMRTLLGHKKNVHSMSFHPDGQILASSSEDKTINLWDVPSGKLKKRIRTGKHPVKTVMFSPDGKTLAGVDVMNGLYLLDVSSGALKMDFDNDSKSTLQISFSTDGKSLLSWNYGGLFTVWDVTTGKHNTINTNHSRNLSDKLFSPDGRLFAITTNHFTKEGGRIVQIDLWDVVAGHIKHTLLGHTDEILSLAFTPDGSTIASGSRDKTIRLWDVDTGEQLHILTDPRWHPGYLRDEYDVSFVSFTLDGGTLVSGIQVGDIYLWDTDTGQQKQILSGHTSRIEQIIFSEGGQPIASSSIDGTVLIWENTSVTNEQDSVK